MNSSALSGLQIISYLITNDLQETIPQRVCDTGMAFVTEDDSVLGQGKYERERAAYRRGRVSLLVHGA